MSLVKEFESLTKDLPDDWTDLTFNLTLVDEKRYIDAATYLVVCNAQPYSKSKDGTHWRVNVAHRFGHAAAPEAVKTAFKLLDQAGIEAEISAHEVRCGRAEVVQMWGRPESVREEFRKQRAQ